MLHSPQNFPTNVMNGRVAFFSFCFPFVACMLYVCVLDLETFTTVDTAFLPSCFQAVSPHADKR